MVDKGVRGSMAGSLLIAAIVLAACFVLEYAIIATGGP